MTADMSSGIHLLDGLLADLQDAVVVGPFTSLMDILKRLELLLSGDAGAAADLELQPDFMINEQQAELLSTLLAAATLHPFEAHGDSHAAVLRVVQAAAASTHCPTFPASCAKMLQGGLKLDGADVMLPSHNMRISILSCCHGVQHIWLLCVLHPPLWSPRIPSDVLNCGRMANGVSN
eukprot:TRINITY_DN8356_c0_g1_i1.p1 TRINITY_DN8356_c0_g1~~TRINITY_DN8356_c0_g1_i1.p1  ORF type:complete len:178 (-),score=26.22 TRINITY_DN8356_c0_g1_i1:1442-1975(-)